ncbi:hypothetical protein [Roseivirga sp.]|uniref:hypothetical protein n=1 Tax=Roseivirga sp. TaxID=1964215 RepID=UPI003B519283
MKKLLLIFWLFGSVASFAQIEHISRYEIEHDWDNLDYVVISNEEKGVLVIQPQYSGSSNRYPIVFHHLDKNLEFQWADTLSVNKRLQLRGYHYAGDKTILLFQNVQQNRLIKIVSVNLNEEQLLEYEPKSIVDLQIEEFEVVQDHAIIGGYIQDRPAVFAYDLTNDKVRTLSNVFQNRSELVEVRVNYDSLTFNVLSSVENAQKDRTIVVNTYDYAGNAIRSYQLNTAKDHQLLSGVSSSIIDREQVVVGLYCIKAGTFPSGMYINHVDRTGKQNMKYVSFGEFSTFLNHNGERKAEKLKEKALEAKNSSKIWRYKIDALFSEMVETEDRLLLMGEFYKPNQMSTQDYMRAKYGLNDYNNDVDNYRNGNYRWNPIGTANSFRNDETRFTHAFALAMDLKGNMLWDSSMEIEEDQPMPLNNFGAFETKGDQVYYSYYFDEELFGKLLYEEPGERLMDVLQLMSEEEKLRYEKEEYQGVVGWYDNKFLVFGVQNIRGAEGTENRRVFFLNAIAVNNTGDTSH